MRVRDRVTIAKGVRKFVSEMPSGYQEETKKELLISEILKANRWFLSVREPDQIIREEVEKQFDTYVVSKIQARD